MNKPIEVGCLVLILRSQDPEYTGKAGVVVQEDDGTPYINKFTSRLESTPGNWDVEVPGCDDLFNAPSPNLLRIDDYDPSQDVVEEDKEIEKC